MRLTRNTGNAQGIFKTEQDMVDAGSKNDRRLGLLSGERYFTSAVDSGVGILLSSGNYANPIASVTTFNTRAGDVVPMVGDYDTFYASEASNWGKTVGVRLPSDDADVVAINSIYYTESEWVGSPIVGIHGDNRGYLTTNVWSTSTEILQTFVNRDGSSNISMWRRREAGVWNSWVRVATSTEVAAVVVQITQADYDLLAPPVATTLYVIIG